MAGILNAKIPEGPLDQKWTLHKENLKTVSPANRSRMHIIVVGTGLAGASAAAALGEQGYRVNVFCMGDSPRRAHSVSAQGGINAAKNYRNDNDSVQRLFTDTLKGGDFRSREANVYRLAEVSNAIIDHCVALGVPFARDYAGYLDNRSFGGSQVSRTFYARGQTGQQLLLAAYGALNRQVALGNVTVHCRQQMMDLVVIEGQAKRHYCWRTWLPGRIGNILPTRWFWLTGRLFQCVFSIYQRHEFQCLGTGAMLEKRRLFCESGICTDTSHMHTGTRDTPVQTDIDE